MACTRSPPSARRARSSPLLPRFDGAAPAATGFSSGTHHFAACAIITGLLVWEHWIVGKGDLRRIDKAFFDVNAYVSVVFFALVVLDEALR